MYLWELNECACSCSVLSKFWEYNGKPHATLSPLTPAWTKLSCQHVVANTSGQCLQLLFAGQGQINVDNAFLGKAKVPTKLDDDAALSLDISYRCQHRNSILTSLHTCMYVVFEYYVRR